MRPIARKLLALMTALLLMLGTMSLPAFAENSAAPYALVFSYDFKQHFLPGGKAIEVNDITRGLSIQGEYDYNDFDDVSVSKGNQLRVTRDDHDDWYVEPLAEFTDREDIYVTLFGKEYTIYVTM